MKLLVGPLCLMNLSNSRIEHSRDQCFENIKIE
jgi:hypothetical protein